MLKRPILLLLLLTLTVLGCNGRRSPEPSMASAGPSASNEEFVSADDLDVGYFFEEELDFHDSGRPPFVLSEGQLGWDGGAARPPLAETTPLSTDRLLQLLARLDPLQEGESDTEQFRLPEQSLPPPRPGSEVESPFPPTQTDSSPETPPDAALAVLRFSPHGNVPLAPQLSVTFNLPMAPLTSHQQLAGEDIPVRLEPAVAGHWRWVGAKTLLFEARMNGADRMPMATEYSAVVPAGTMSADGSKLAEAVRWTFQTPAPTLQSVNPIGGPVGLEPVLFAS